MPAHRSRRMFPEEVLPQKASAVHQEFFMDRSPVHIGWRYDSPVHGAVHSDEKLLVVSELVSLLLDGKIIEKLYAESEAEARGLRRGGLMVDEILKSVEQSGPRASSLEELNVAAFEDALNELVAKTPPSQPEGPPDSLTYIGHLQTPGKEVRNAMVRKLEESFASPNPMKERDLAPGDVKLLVLCCNKVKHIVLQANCP